MPFPWLAAATAGSALLGAGASLFGSRQSAQSQEATNAANAQMAREQMAFQERMDNTKYQRGVADAKAAGFNPLVAFPGSGGSPMGASAVMQNPSPNRGELYFNTARMAAEVAKTWADAKLSDNMSETEDTKQELNRVEIENKKFGTVGIPGFANLPVSGLSRLGFNTANFTKNVGPKGGEPIKATGKSTPYSPYGLNRHGTAYV